MNTGKINLKWGMAVEKAIVDQKTNQMSLVGIVEEMNIESKGRATIKTDGMAIPVNINIVSHWEREKSDNDEKFDFQLSCISKDGEVVSNKNIPLELNKGIFRMRSIVNVQNLMFNKKSNTYYFIITYFIDKKKMEYKIPVVINFKISE